MNKIKSNLLLIINFHTSCQWSQRWTWRQCWAHTEKVSRAQDSNFELWHREHLFVNGISAGFLFFVRDILYWQKFLCWLQSYHVCLIWVGRWPVEIPARLLLGFLQFCYMNVWWVPPARVLLLSSKYFLTHYYMLPFNAKSMHYWELLNKP